MYTMCTLLFLKIKGTWCNLIETVNTNNSWIFKCSPLRFLLFRIYYLLHCIPWSRLPILNTLHFACLFLKKKENKLKAEMKIIRSCYFHFNHIQLDLNSLQINKFNLFSRGSTRILLFRPKQKLIKNWLVFPTLSWDFYRSLGTKILLFRKLSKHVFYSQLWLEQILTRSYIATAQRI